MNITESKCYFLLINKSVSFEFIIVSFFTEEASVSWNFSFFFGIIMEMCLECSEASENRTRKKCLDIFVRVGQACGIQPCVTKKNGVINRAKIWYASRGVGALVCCNYEYLNTNILIIH